MYASLHHTAVMPLFVSRFLSLAELAIDPLRPTVFPPDCLLLLR
jgi:hypothetical protein